eukprot:evm.model.scf_84.4 EVM.evm.TU.scf_84.4   scf_84:62963-64163(-)
MAQNPLKDPLTCHFSTGIMPTQARITATPGESATTTSGPHSQTDVHYPSLSAPAEFFTPPIADEGVCSRVLVPRQQERPQRRPQTAQAVLVAAGSGARAARERLRSALRREAKVRMESEMARMDAEDMKVEKEMALAAAGEEASARDDLERELQDARNEIRRLKQDGGWQTAQQLRSDNEGLNVRLGAATQEIDHLRRCLKDAKRMYDEVQSALREERKYWMECWGMKQHLPFRAGNQSCLS